MIVSAVLSASMAIAPRKPHEVYPPGEERRILAHYTSCLVKSMPQTAARFVVEQGSDGKLAEKLRIPNCLPIRSGVVMMARPLFRYALADALIRTDRSIRLPDMKAVPGLDHGTIEQELEATASRWNKAWEAKHIAQRRAVAAQHIAISRFGECVVRAAPAHADEMLRSEVASAAEKTAIRKLSPILSTCVDKGATIAFSPEVVRGTIALNYYRLAKAPRAAAPGVSK